MVDSALMDATAEVDISRVWWRPKRPLGFDDWRGMGLTLQAIKKSLPWWLGDWCNFGMDTFGEVYAQAIELTGHDLETLKKYAYVARHIPFYLRREELSWTHHVYVAPLVNEIGPAGLELMRLYLAHAVTQDLTTAEFKEFVEAKKLLRQAEQFAERQERTAPTRQLIDQAAALSALAQAEPEVVTAGLYPASDPGLSEEEEIASLIDEEIRSTIYLPGIPRDAARYLADEMTPEWLREFIRALVPLLP